MRTWTGASRASRITQRSFQQGRRQVRGGACYANFRKARGMAEIHVSLLEFFIGQLGAGSTLEKYSKHGDWIPGKAIPEFSKALLRKGSRVLLKRAGTEFSEKFYEIIAGHTYTGVENAVSLIPKAFAHYLRGEGSGIVKIQSVAQGMVRISENSPFDCLFTEGLLEGFLHKLGARGVIVRQTACRNDNENVKFCVYDLKWMHTNKPGVR